MIRSAILLVHSETYEFMSILGLTPLVKLSNLNNATAGVSATEMIDLASDCMASFMHFRLAPEETTGFRLNQQEYSEDDFRASCKSSLVT